MIIYARPAPKRPMGENVRWLNCRWPYKFNTMLVFFSNWFLIKPVYHNLFVTVVFNGNNRSIHFHHIDLHHLFSNRYKCHGQYLKIWKRCTYMYIVWYYYFDCISNIIKIVQINWTFKHWVSERIIIFKIHN